MIQAVKEKFAQSFLTWTQVAVIVATIGGMYARNSERMDTVIETGKDTRKELRELNAQMIDMRLSLTERVVKLETLIKKNN